MRIRKDRNTPGFFAVSTRREPHFQPSALELAFLVRDIAEWLVTGPATTAKSRFVAGRAEVAIGTENGHGTLRKYSRIFVDGYLQRSFLVKFFRGDTHKNAVVLEPRLAVTTITEGLVRRLSTTAERHTRTVRCVDGVSCGIDQLHGSLDQKRSVGHAWIFKSDIETSLLRGGR